MKVLCVMGSPRKGGNTDSVLRWVEQDLAAGGHQVEHVDVIDNEIGGCTGCNTCKLEPEKPGCIIEDDADGLLLKMMDADLTVMATPLYCWGMTSQLKALVDRSYSLKKPLPDGTHVSLIAGKRIALLVTCAGPYDGNAEVLSMPFDRIAWWSQTEVAGTLFITGCTTPDALPEDARERAVQFAAEIAAQ